MMVHHQLTLADAPIGRHMRVKHLHSQPEVCHRLREMGFCENAVIRCITKDDGNVICEICNTRIGLSSGIASHIVVAAFE
jgi:ferrous iron transport protein A